MDHDEEEGPFLEPNFEQEQQYQDEEEEQNQDQDQDQDDEDGEQVEGEGEGGEVPQETAKGNLGYHDIFGGDSDLSDQESDKEDEEEDEDNEESSPAPTKLTKKSKHTYRDEEPSEGEEASSEEEDRGEKGGEDGEYDAGNEDDAADKLKAMKFKKKPKQKKAREEGEEGGEEGEEDQPRKKKKKTKSTPQNIEEPEEYIEPEIAKRRALHARIDEIIKKPKSTQKKSKGQQDDDLDAMNDEAITKLRSDMFIAADQDIEENENGRFAIYKLKMLPEVVRLMQKTTLAESIVENGLLEAVRKWLEPLQDGSLPAVNIQRPLFEILRTLTIDTIALRTCGLGKIVYFYTKCKRVEPTIARMANGLVSDWMRPIIRNSKSLADREIEITRESEPRIRSLNNLGRIAGTTSNMRAAELAQSQSQAGTPATGSASARPTNETIARRHARIPEMLTATFKVAPMKDARDRENGNGMSSSNVVVGGKMKNYKKKLIAGQQASRRV